MSATGAAPKFSANLSMMFQEVPFMERFAAAAKLGFKAVEFMFPYDYAIADLKAAPGISDALAEAIHAFFQGDG